MSLQYSSGTIIHRTGAINSRQDWCNLVTQACSDAGWGTIAGTPGFSSDVTLETAAGNQSQKFRVRFLEPGSGNCAQTSFKNVAGTITSQSFFALSSSSTWRVVANKFHFFSFIVGSSNRLTARTFICGGILYVPTFLSLSSGDTTCFMTGTGISDVDVSSRVSLRNTIREYDNANAGGRFSAIYVSSLIEGQAYTNSNAGGPSIATWQGGLNAGDQAYRWEDTTLPIYEPLMAWGTAGSFANEARLKGQLYDAAVINGGWTGETQITFDGHTWLAVTDQATANVSSSATLFVAIA